MSKNVLKYLSSVSQFSVLSQDELETLAKSASFKRYPKGTVISEKNKTILSDIFVIKKGEITLYDEINRKRKATGSIKRGQIFGGIVILLNAGLAVRTTIVTEGCTGFRIPGKMFQELCNQNKTFFEFFLETISSNLRIFDENLISFVEKGKAQNFLPTVEPFVFLPEDEIEEISASLYLIHYPKNLVMFSQGQSRLRFLYILYKGAAEQYNEDAGEKTNISKLDEGNIYGGISLLVNQGISLRTLHTLENSQFYLLPQQQFFDICERHKTFSEYFTNAFGKNMMKKSYAAMVAKAKLLQEEDLLFFNQPVLNICCKEFVFCGTATTIHDAAKIMSGQNISSLFVKNHSGDCVGVVTERDLTRKVIVNRIDNDDPIASIMSSPVRKISAEVPVFESMMALIKDAIRHLAVTDNNNRVIGVLSNRDFLIAQSHSELFLLGEISSATDIAGIIDRHKILPKLLQSLITKGANARNVTSFITSVSDVILTKLVDFTLDEMGPPPVDFAFIILGSEGRKEQTLKTDQDNAIIYDDGPSGMESAIKRYFCELGQKICTSLDQVGYTFCIGNIMAKNPKWCQPLSKWKEYFSHWTCNAGAEDLLWASIFFDFRWGYGNKSFVDHLREHLFESIKRAPGFFRNLVKNSQQHKPPLGFFRNFVVESKGEHRDAFNIKNAMTPIVDFARVYALKHEIGDTNTLERLDQLRNKNVQTQQEYEETEKAYSFLIQLRYVKQLTAIMNENKEPDNYIKPKELTRIEQKMLKEIFERIGYLQKKMKIMFRGVGLA